MFKNLLIVIGTMMMPVLAQSQSDAIGPPPGRLVDIGGRRLHLNCAGQGSPTVIFEAGAGAFSVDWSLVQPEVARTTRACSYDRARYAWSDPSPSAEMPASVVRDLHAVLEAADERPPYVLVGHSMGGIYARIYAQRYPSEVAGLVLVDPTHEEGLFVPLEGRPVTIGSLTAAQLLAAVPVGDVQVPLRSPQMGEPYNQLRPELYKLRVELERRLISSDSSKPVAHAIVVEAMEGQRAAFAELASATRMPAPVLGNRPVVILSRGRDLPERQRQLHMGLARISTDSRSSVVAGAGHEIQLYKPAAVVQAVQDVLNSFRTSTPLAAR